MFRNDLVADVTSLNYDFEKHLGLLFMPEGCCCDMTGCIVLFEAIDPDVSGVLTFAGSIVDTRYTLRDGQWHADDLRPLNRTLKDIVNGSST